MSTSGAGTDAISRETSAARVRSAETPPDPVRETATTLAPAARSASAVAAPIPRDAPVTSAVRPASKSRSVLVVGEPQKLIARLRVVTEAAAQGAGDGLGVLLLHAAHHHAQVLGLDDDADAARAERLLEGQCDLLGEPLLDLEPPGIYIDDAGHLREADDAAIRDLRHVRAAEERQHVVLAQRVELDVPHHDHALVPGLLEQRIANDLRGVHRVAAREELERFGDALRRLDQPLAVGIFAEQLQLAADETR